MVGTEPYAARLAALEQRQRRIIRQVRWLLLIATLLTVVTCWQQTQNRWLMQHNQRLVEILKLKLMQPLSGLPRL